MKQDTTVDKPQPLLFFLISILLAAGLHFWVPLKQWVFFPWNLAGLIPLFWGFWINIRADGRFKEERTSVKVFRESSVLLDSGPFRWTRNPMYLGMLSVILGICVLFGSLSVYIAMLFFFLVSVFHFIPVEERMLEERFGEQYRKYRRRTRRWL